MLPPRPLDGRGCILPYRLVGDRRTRRNIRSGGGLSGPARVRIGGAAIGPSGHPLSASGFAARILLRPRRFAHYLLHLRHVPVKGVLRGRRLDFGKEPLLARSARARDLRADRLVAGPQAFARVGTTGTRPVITPP